MWKVIIFVVQVLCLAFSAKGSSYHNQEPVSLCAGKEITTKFVYGDSTVKFINLTVINWTVRKTKQDTAEIFCYYNNNNGFKIRPGQGDRFKDRVTWVPNTINLKFSDLITNDTGFYDVAITIFGAGKEETKDTNATFQLTVNDPCLIEEGENEKGCTMLDCSSMEVNPVYSWTGKDAEGETVRSIEVCPKEETNYTCCVDAMKTKCSSFTAQAGEFQTTEDNNTKDNGENDGGLPTGAIVGIIIGVLVFIGIIVAVIYIRNRKGDGGYFAASSN
ncbi:uncharacterized protein [Mytilus edulis]|uniref:uncharacterized protein isoform X2 n=1 Tax=Mytilus edulis TaxID=6550 RepID=UPI0039EE7338